ncbi:hypothetical protein M1D72_20995 [Vibrio sp. AK197]
MKNNITSILLSTGISKFVDKVFGVFRNYLISNYTNTQVSDSFYLVASFMEVFANSTIKREEIECSYNKSIRQYDSYNLILFFILSLLLSLIFISYYNTGFIGFLGIFLGVLLYSLYKGLVTNLKINISSRLSCLIEVFFAAIMTLTVFSIIKADLLSSRIYFIYLFSSIIILFFLIFIQKKKDLLKSLHADKYFFTIFILGAMPFLERNIISSLGDGALTNFVISYMIVSIPLMILPTSTIMVVLNKYGWGEMRLILPLQILLVLVGGGSAFYINRVVGIFPQTSLDMFFSAFLYALSNIFIGYYETGSIINRKSSRILIIRKGLSITTLFLYVYLFNVYYLSTFSFIYFCINFLSLLVVKKYSSENQ